MKKKRSITGFGIGCIIVLAVIMVVHVYPTFEDTPFYLRILEGLLRFGAAFIGSGLFLLALFIAMYGAIKLSGDIFVDDQSDDELMEHFNKLSNPIFIICFVVAYIAVFFNW